MIRGNHAAKYLALVLGMVSQITFAEELDLPTWKKEIRYDIPAQKVLVYSKEHTIGDRIVRSYITQTRNDNEWHWSQSFGLVENGSFKQIAWNTVLGDGPEIQRWYCQNSTKGISYVVSGTAEIDGYKDAKAGERFLVVNFPETNPMPDPPYIIWIANAHGIFEPRLAAGEVDKKSKNGDF